MASLRLIRLPPIRTQRNFTSASKSTPSFQTAAYITLFAFTAGVGGVYYFDSRAAIHRYLIAPVIRNLLDPESGHKLAVSALENGFGPRDMLPDDERLKTEVRPTSAAWPTKFNRQLFSALGSNTVEPCRSCSGVRQRRTSN
jgi:dihydroorotate dehydrogenase